MKHRNHWRRLAALAATLLALSTLFAGCKKVEEDLNKKSSTSTPAITSDPAVTPNPSDDVSEPVSGGTDTKGAVGDFEVEILSLKKVKSTDNKDAIVVTYKWTNNSAADKSFATALAAKAFQNGTELGLAVVIGEEMDGTKLIADVKPGASLEVQKAYALADSSDVLVEVSELISLISTAKVTRTFALSAAQ
ncbi:MAG: DUF5067 domain-containing protein [Oscillospiraceae bacterium]|nr:DUF5067 domain-containing protein [Oscillospiraceae bacterium]